MTVARSDVRATAAATALAVALATSGCGASLANGVDRSAGFSGPVSPVSRDLVGSADDVPVSGHQVTVRRVGPGQNASGELIVASDAELVVETSTGSRVRVALSDVESISIELHPSHAASTALITVGAIALGAVGLSVARDSGGNGFGNFLGGWGLVWIPLGVLVALPATLGVALSNDHTVHRARPEFARLLPHLHEFARYPQGEPGRASPPPPYSPPPPESSTPAPEPPSPPAAIPPPAPPAVDPEAPAAQP